ncbi:uncharacterized protein Tco025E_01275 [Trypanosoma conorhini]|uniref:Uncharacterized protein n=1 Tax=Trypanosoma conorhini TaxID=83891 RepID=A0A422Q913_9TRYP|nr:uncharacterized protein Tco025E_01275 [Trypanosoma conorhini]RNF26434.1 hypothetical protein Tco025E_01275 [Trypanosoma conorhini]
MSKQRRESAFALVQRLKASPVGLLPPIFHNATDGGLRQSDVLVVGGAPGTGKTTWAYRLAAQHLSCGGGVTIVFLPGSGNFQMRRFMEHLETFAATPESFALSSPCQCSAQAADAAAMEARRQALLGALDRLEAVHCLDMNDFFVYCSHAVASASPRAGSQEVAVPLLLVEGAGGKGSYLYHLERAIGHEVPLCHWLLDCLQRRRRCALIIIEEWGCEGVGPSWPLGSTREENPSPFVSVVEEESDFLHRLQKETAQRKAVVRQHFAKRQRVSSATPTTNTATVLTIAGTSSALSATAPVPMAVNLGTELHWQFAGSRRLFYLCTQMLPVAARGVSPVARLLQWRPTEQSTRGENNNNNAAEPTEPMRQQRWRQLPEVRTRLRGEVLCAAQL